MQKHTKKALTLSVLSLVLCVSMLVGTTFAWFTDSVTTGVNTIQSGTLDVDLVDAAGVSLAGKTLNFKTADGRSNDEILWEPGCTYYTQDFKVVNNGNLNLAYTIIVTGIDGDAKLNEAIDWTVVPADTGIVTMSGTLAPNDATSLMRLQGHMKEEAGNEYQGLSMSGIGITVYATQVEAEYDSFDNIYDADARLEYTYDAAKSAQENAAALQALIDTAIEGTTIVVSAGTYDVSGISGHQIKLAKDNLTLVGESGVVINDDGEGSSNVQAVIKITGDNVTVSNISATDKGGNTVILISDANNVTVNNCTLKGYADPTWGQYLEAGVMIYTNDPDVSPITKYNVTNNTFIDCNINVMNGAGNGGKSEDLIISGNTFKNAAVLIEHNQTSVPDGDEEAWHKYDINVLPTIKNNLFESPSIWLGSTPFAIYLRVYRDNDVASMTPASYWTDFVANNVIMDYTGEKVSTDGKAALIGENGVQMRPNGKVQYYGLNFGDAVSTADGLKDALAAGGNIVLTADVAFDKNTTVTVASGVETTLDLNGHTISTTADKTGNQELFLVKGNMTVQNGSMEFTAKNNQEWNAMATLFDVTAGGVLNLENVTADISGTDMNFIVHLNNWGSATLNVNNCDFTASYVAVRAFNSGYDMNTVTIKNTDFHTGRVFWVHNYTSEGKDDSTLTLDIYGNNNTTDNAKPVRFGFSGATYYDINGNLIP